MSSEPCAICASKRVSRARCNCCRQYLCRDHLKEHDDLLHGQWEPLTDQLNQLLERVTHLDHQSILRPAREQLDEWRRRAMESIEEVSRETWKELNESLAEQLEGVRDETKAMQREVDRLIREEGTTQERIDSFTANIERLSRETNEILAQPVQLDLRPVLVHRPPTLRRVQRRWHFSPVLQTRFLSSENRHRLSVNETQLLVYHHPKLSLLDLNLTLLRETDLRPAMQVNGISWSARLTRFLILTDTDLFLLDPDHLSLEKSSIPSRTDGHWHCLTCSADSLYLTVYKWGTHLHQYHFGPFSLDFRRQIQLPIQSPKDHSIDQFIYYQENSLVMLLQRRIDHRKQFQLRSDETLECLWSIELDPSFATLERTRFCLFNEDQWLLIHPNQRQLIPVSINGSVQPTIDGHSTPIHDVLHIRENFLLLTTHHSLNLHQLVESNHCKEQLH